MRCRLQVLIALLAMGLAVAGHAPPARAAELPPRLAPAPDLELHMVGLTGGFYANAKQALGRSRVHVDRPGKRVVLCLNGYLATSWKVSVAADTTLARVYVGGQYLQSVAGLPENTLKVYAYYDARNPQLWLSPASQLETRDFRIAVRELHAATGLLLASFHGAESLDEDRPITVNRVEDNPAFSLDYPQPKPAADLPAVSFSALHLPVLDWKYGTHTSYAVSYGEFTLQGPRADTLLPIALDIKTLLHDEPGKRFLGLIRDHCHVVEPFEHAAANRVIEPAAFSEERIHCLTLDPKRQRLVAWPYVTNHPGPVAISLTNGQVATLHRWPKNEQRDYLQPVALAYAPEKDVIYGISQYLGPTQNHAGVPPAMLCEIDAETGELRQTAPLGNLIMPKTSVHNLLDRRQLISVGEHLVYLTTDDQFDVGAQLGGSSIFLIDPNTATVTLTHREPHSAPNKSNP
ncbi:MAG: hypothetical protein K1X74_14280 [Pirellulales bacterium]|nr:hypothetical protein [Pirellulales bacterium]